MFRSLFITIVSSVFLLSAKAQETENRQLPSFTGIEIESSAKIHLRKDPVQSVNVSTNGHLRNVETNVSNNVLRIKGKDQAEFTISVPELDYIGIGGNGEIIGENSFSGNKLKLEISGNGKMTMEVHYEKLEADISGLGKITLNGTAEKTDFNISGSGKVDAMELKSNNCKTNISGLGKCSIDVSDTLTTNISGSGKVDYKHEPKVQNQNISGLGKVGDKTTFYSESDTTNLNLGDTKVIIISPRDSVKIKKKSHPKPIWGGFEMGINSWVTSSGSFDMPPAYSGFELHQEKSVSVGLNIVQQNFQLGKSNVWFMTGFGFTWNNYHFADNITLNNTTPLTTYSDTSSSIRYIKSKLVVSYLTVPLMFEAFTSRNKKHAFHLGAGMLLGMRLGSHTKQKIETDNNIYKPKVFGNFNLDPFRYGFRVAIGYGKFNVFADYYASALFKDNKGPELYPVNFGITLVGF